METWQSLEDEEEEEEEGEEAVSFRFNLIFTKSWKLPQPIIMGYLPCWVSVPARTGKL